MGHNLCRYATVCCKKADVGKAELDMGLQSGMAASQAWIRERATSGIPWNEPAAASASASASSSSQRAAGGINGNNAGAGAAGAPVTSAALAGLGSGQFMGRGSGSGGSGMGGMSMGAHLASLRTSSGASVRSAASSDGEDQFFDAEDDAFSDYGDYSLSEADVTEVWLYTS
jgi:hypothetical protein